MSSLDLTAPLARSLARWGLVASMRGSMIACKFLLALFISRYLDLASLGLYGLIAGAVAIVPALTGFGMVHSIMRDAVTSAPAQLTDSLRHYWGYTAALYGVVLPATMVTTFSLDQSPIWVVVVFIILFEQLGNDVFQLFSNLDRPLLANLTAFLRGAAWILFYVPLALWIPELRSLQALFTFWLLGSASSFAVFAVISRTWPWREAFRLPFRPSWIASRIRTSVVIYASDLCYIASQYIDRYLVTLFLGLKLAGVYMLYWTAANAMYTFVGMAVFQQQRPFLIKAHHEGNAVHRDLCARLMRATLLCTAVLGLTVAVAFQVAVPLLRQPLAIANLAAFWWIVAGMIARCIADWGAMALFTSRRDRIMTFTNLVATVVLASSQAILLPSVGLKGAGLALLLTFGAVAYWRHRLVFSPRFRIADAP